MDRDKRKGGNGKVQDVVRAHAGRDTRLRSAETPVQSRMVCQGGWPVVVPAAGRTRRRGMCRWWLGSLVAFAGVIAGPAGQGAAVAQAAEPDPAARPAQAAPAHQSVVYVQAVSEQTAHAHYVYPQLRGMRNAAAQARVNAVLKRWGTPAPADAAEVHTVDSSFSVLLKRGSFLELMLNSYDYAQGAAHGMPNQRVAMINTDTGVLYQIGDLFKPGANYMARLSAGVREQDRQHVLDTFQKFTGVKATDGFYLNDTGVTVFFYPYEWTPYAYGFPQFTVPYAKLQDLIDTQGSLWQVLHSPGAAKDRRNEAAQRAKLRQLGYQPETDLYASFAVAATSGGEGLYAWNAVPLHAKDPADSRQRVFFFLGGRYLGADAPSDHGPVYALRPAGLNALAVSYIGNTQTYEQSANFTLTFRWDGKHLTHMPDFPKGYLNGKPGGGQAGP